MPVLREADGIEVRVICRLVMAPVAKFGLVSVGQIVQGRVKADGCSIAQSAPIESGESAGILESVSPETYVAVPILKG